MSNLEHVCVGDTLRLIDSNVVAVVVFGPFRLEGQPSDVDPSFLLCPLGKYGEILIYATGKKCPAGWTILDRCFWTKDKLTVDGEEVTIESVTLVLRMKALPVVPLGLIGVGPAGCAWEDLVLPEQNQDRPGILRVLYLDPGPGFLASPQISTFEMSSKFDFTWESDGVCNPWENKPADAALSTGANWRWVSYGAVIGNMRVVGVQRYLLFQKGQTLKCQSLSDFLNSGTVKTQFWTGHSPARLPEGRNVIDHDIFLRWVTSENKAPEPGRLYACGKPNCNGIHTVKKENSMFVVSGCK